MSVDALLTAALGPGGVLVVLAVALMFLLKGQIVVPSYIYEAAKQQIKDLDTENGKLNSSVNALIEQIGELKTQIARLEEQVKHMRQTQEREAK